MGSDGEEAAGHTLAKALEIFTDRNLTEAVKLAEATHKRESAAILKRDAKTADYQRRNGIVPTRVAWPEGDILSVAKIALREAVEARKAALMARLKAGELIAFYSDDPTTLPWTRIQTSTLDLLEIRDGRFWVKPGNQIREKVRSAWRQRPIRVWRSDAAPGPVVLGETVQLDRPANEREKAAEEAKKFLISKCEYYCEKDLSGEYKINKAEKKSKTEILEEMRIKFGPLLLSAEERERIWVSVTSRSEYERMRNPGRRPSRPS